VELLEETEAHIKSKENLSIAYLLSSVEILKYQTKIAKLLEYFESIKKDSCN
jgi:hypothetical protein